MVIAGERCLPLRDFRRRTQPKRTKITVFCYAQLVEKQATKVYNIPTFHIREAVMEIAAVRGLSKDYPEFHLRDVTFSLESGRIIGFIGRNGAGY